MNSDSQILLDFGGTHTKSQTWNNGVLVNQSIARSPQVKIGPRGEATIDPQEFARHAVHVFEEAKRLASGSCEVAISSQMASFVLTDDLGRPVGEIISWQDERSLYNDRTAMTPIQRIRANLEEEVEMFWDGIRAGTPLCYLHERVREERIPESTHLLSLAQFAVLAIEPSRRPNDLKMHCSEAASTGLFDPIKSRWSDSLIDALGLGQLTYPKVTDQFEFIGDGMKAFVPIGDFQAAIEGSAVTENELFIHIATGGQVARPIARSQLPTTIDLASNSIQVRPSVDPEKLILAKTHLPAGRLLSSLMNLTCMNSDNSYWEFIDSSLLKSSKISTNFFADHGFSFSLSYLSPRGISSHEIIVSIVKSVHEVYLETARQIGLHGVLSLVFSGGSLTKLPTFMRQFETRLGIESSRSYREDDTSLKGLASLMKVI